MPNKTVSTYTYCTKKKKKEEERMSITTHYLKVATHNRAASFQLHELTVSNATIQELN